MWLNDRKALGEGKRQPRDARGTQGGAGAGHCMPSWLDMNEPPGEGREDGYEAYLKR